MDTMAVPRVLAMLRGFADPLRLRILGLLRDGEMCVGDLVTVLGVPQPTASRHLGHLKRAGLIVSRKHGYWTFYQLAPARGAAHGRLIECLEACGREMAELARDARQAARLKERGGCCPQAARQPAAASGGESA
jgi:ArsR family transcriptional regulator